RDRLLRKRNRFLVTVIDGGRSVGKNGDSLGILGIHLNASLLLKKPISAIVEGTPKSDRASHAASTVDFLPNNNTGLVVAILAKAAMSFKNASNDSGVTRSRASSSASNISPTCPASTFSTTADPKARKRPPAT